MQRHITLTCLDHQVCLVNTHAAIATSISRTSFHLVNQRSETFKVSSMSIPWPWPSPCLLHKSAGLGISSEQVLQSFQKPLFLSMMASFGDSLLRKCSLSWLYNWDFKAAKACAKNSYNGSPRWLSG